MSKILYLMRHGQTMFNLRGKVQGASDSPLTQLGITQAKEAGNYFKQNHIIFDEAFSSSSERACDTLENVLPDKAYQRNKGLKEWSFGLFEGDSVQLLDAVWDKNDIFGNRLFPFGGETKNEVEHRIVTTMSNLVESSEGTTLLAVSHGTAIQVFLRKWIGDDMANQYIIGNCCILKFIYTDGEFKFIDMVDPTIEDDNK
ncbi:broad specificity phosphatase PhoE [Staphylococcus hominis]